MRYRMKKPSEQRFRKKRQRIRGDWKKGTLWEHFKLKSVSYWSVISTICLRTTSYIRTTLAIWKKSDSVYLFIKSDKILEIDGLNVLIMKHLIEFEKITHYFEIL